MSLSLQAVVEPFEEFVRDPALTVACVMLIVVSVAWVVVAHRISRNFREADRAAGPAPRAKGARRVWKKPPR
jgi:ATP/ADP translocase